uniref:Uncharacterized protein n=1 Tax=Caenorhabditis japonica TaxID=281687 RepID=A0A8R1HQB0_CAEJA
MQGSSFRHATRHAHLTTVFTDEKLFSLEAEFNPQNHRGLAQVPQEANSKGRLVHRAAHPQQIMVFGGITSNGKTPLVFFGARCESEPGILQILAKRRDII